MRKYIMNDGKIEVEVALSEVLGRLGLVFNDEACEAFMEMKPGDTIELKGIKINRIE